MMLVLGSVLIVGPVLWAFARAVGGVLRKAVLR